MLGTYGIGDFQEGRWQKSGWPEDPASQEQTPRVPRNREKRGSSQAEGPLWKGATADP